MSRCRVCAFEMPTNLARPYSAGTPRTFGYRHRLDVTLACMTTDQDAIEASSHGRTWDEREERPCFRKPGGWRKAVFFTCSEACHAEMKRLVREAEMLENAWEWLQVELISGSLQYPVYRSAQLYGECMFPDPIPLGTWVQPAVEPEATP